MKKPILSTLCLAMSLLVQGQTLETCQQAAEQHYPLVKQYALIDQTAHLTIDHLQKMWWPQVVATASATYQNRVTAWPEDLRSRLGAMGLDLKGLKKDQYKVGIEVQQTIYDGGRIRGQKAIAHQQAQVEHAQNTVSLYAVRQRVNELYFALLLLDEQIHLSEDVQTLLKSVEQQLERLVQGGTAATSDYQAVQAERLQAQQQCEAMQAQREQVREMLSLCCGMPVTRAEKPMVVSPVEQGMRPELRVMDEQIKLADAQTNALNYGVRPTFGVFAQGYYGAPGLNLFEDMTKRQWSLNGLVGVKLSWNIGALYTLRADKARLEVQRQKVEQARQTFLLNNSIEQAQHKATIERYRHMLQSDSSIIALRRSVRQASESKLRHGIIDTNALIREINHENAAKIQQSLHEIEMLRAVYNLKFTNNE